MACIKIGITTAKGEKKGLKLGDAAHAILGPIGRALKWPCLKGDGTTDLKPGSPCAKAVERLNNFTQ